MSNGGQKVTAVTSQSLAPDASSTVLRIVTKVVATNGTVINNVANVSGGPGETNLTNNQGEAKVVANNASLPHTGAGNNGILLLGGLLIAVLGALLMARRRTD